MYNRENQKRGTLHNGTEMRKRKKVKEQSTYLISRFCALFLLFILMYSNAAMAEPERIFSDSPDRKIVVGVMHDPPYTIKGENGKWTGLNVDVWSQAARDMNLNYELKEMTLDEMLASLKNGRIDISIAALFVTADRERDFDFSVPIGSTRLAVATLPHAIEHPWWSAIRVFLSWGTLKVIISLLLVLVIIGFIFWLTEHKNNPEHFGGGFLKGISSGIYWVGSTLASGVCFGINIKSLTGRILGLLWMFACAVALSAFIASLSSSLTLHQIGVTTTDANTLKNMKIGTVRGSVPEHLLERIGGKYILFTEEEDVLKALQEKRIKGFLYDEITLHYYEDTEYKGKISIYPTNLKRLSFAFGMPTDSPLRKPVNSSLLKIMNEPLWDFLLDRYGFKENFGGKPITLGKKKN